MGGAAGSDDGVTADAHADTFRSQPAKMLFHTGGPALLEFATEVKWVNDGVHVAVPVGRRELKAVSQPLTPFLTISDHSNVVAPGQNARSVEGKSNGAVHAPRVTLHADRLTFLCVEWPPPRGPGAPI